LLPDECVLQLYYYPESALIHKSPNSPPLWVRIIDKIPVNSKNLRGLVFMGAVMVANELYLQFFWLFRGAKIIAFM
jgi:hypothetical protein